MYFQDSMTIEELRSVTIVWFNRLHEWLHISLL